MRNFFRSAALAASVFSMSFAFLGCDDASKPATGTTPATTAPEVKPGGGMEPSKNAMEPAKEGGGAMEPKGATEPPK